MAVKPIPEGSRTLTAYLTVEGASELMEFLTKAFDAKELHRMRRPDGSLWHAEMAIGDSRLMLGDATPQSRPRPGTLHVYVTEVDATYRAAVQAGAKSLREPANQMYGDRMSGVEDRWGNQWWIATHVEDLTMGEMERRVAEAAKA
jgi:PhnB protein